MSNFQVQGPQIDRREGFSITSDETTITTGLQQDAAEFGAMLLNEGALGDLSGLDRLDVESFVLEAITVVECVCGETVYAAELAMSGECAGCLS